MEAEVYSEMDYCLKFHSSNGSWNYVKQFGNITRGIYAKY